MTLTEQWRKGELPDGQYWVKGISPVNDIVIYEYISKHSGFGYYEKDVIEEVLAPVPSYDEYLTMKDCAKMVFEAAERETKLKELLKKVRDAWVIYKPYDRHQLCKRIDNAIGEKK